MFKYSGERLYNRVQLGVTEAWWLDYWLLLHAEDAHPVWSARPMSVMEVAEAARWTAGSNDRALRRQLKTEILHLARLLSSIQVGAPPPSVKLPVSAGDWPAPWREWLDDIGSLRPELVLDGLIRRIEARFADAPLSELAYYARRTSSELLALHRSKRWLFIRGTRLFLGDRSQPGSVIDGLRELARVYPRRPYRMHLSFAPVEITRRCLDWLSKPDREPVFRRDEAMDTLILEGGILTVDAQHINEARYLALERARSTLDTLRTQFYVASHLIGAIRVEPPAEQPDDFPVTEWVGLPHLFWRDPTGARRTIPTLPIGAPVLTDDDSRRWSAARWHLSKAIAAYREDAHLAAAECWQALESFAPRAGTALERIETLVRAYSRMVFLDAFSKLVVDFADQRWQILAHPELGHSDWRFWHRGSGTEPVAWLQRVLDSRSHRSFGHWRQPCPPPALLFDPDVGLFHMIRRRLTQDDGEQWAERRVMWDMELLYGIRNAVVHRGERPLSTISAEYLAQTAAEVLVAVMTYAKADVDSGRCVDIDGSLTLRGTPPWTDLR